MRTSSTMHFALLNITTKFSKTFIPTNSSEIDNIIYNIAYIWTDGTDTYYSNGSSQYYLDGNEWKEKTWTGLTSFNGSDIWTDGANIYYSYGDTYKLNNDNWSLVTWNNLTNIPSGNYIWLDNIGNIYYSNPNKNEHYILDTGSNTWNIKQWSGISSSTLSGGYIWTDGTTMYYSYNTSHYYLDGDTWRPKVWGDVLTKFSGSSIWTDGTNIYYSHFNPSNTSENYQYIFNGSDWSPISFNGNNLIRGGHIWTDGSIIYYLDQGVKMQLIPKDNMPEIYTKLNGSWIKMGSLPES